MSHPFPSLVLVDGSNLWWRAAHGFPARIRARDGRDLTAPFGFFALLRKALLSLDEPVECLVVFDSEQAWHGRQTRDAANKQVRGDATPGLFEHLATVQQGLTQLGIGWQESGSWEADDVIASLALAVTPRPVLVMSTDKDLHQLLRPGIAQLNTSRSAATRVITHDHVRERYGIEPRQWPDYRALMGDPSDGIRGVPGIGPVRAQRLLASGASVDDLIADPPTTDPAWHLVAPHLNQARHDRRLIALRTDLTCAVTPLGHATQPLPLAAVILAELGLW